MTEHEGVLTSQLRGPIAHMTLKADGTVVSNVVAHHTAAVVHRRRIMLAGCDDQTTIWVDMTPEELEFLEKLAAATQEAAGGSCCKPKLKIALSGGFKSDPATTYERADNLVEYLAEHPELTADDLDEVDR